MTNPKQSSQNRQKTKTDETIINLIRKISEEHKMLIILKTQLYDNEWEPMLDDLKNRLAGKPYIFKLANRIQDDIQRIEEMRRIEKNHNIDLTDYVDLNQ